MVGVEPRRPFGLSREAVLVCLLRERSEVRRVASVQLHLPIPADEPFAGVLTDRVEHQKATISDRLTRLESTTAAS